MGWGHVGIAVRRVLHADARVRAGELLDAVEGYMGGVVSHWIQSLVAIYRTTRVLGEQGFWRAGLDLRDFHA